MPARPHSLLLHWWRSRLSARLVTAICALALVSGAMVSKSHYDAEASFMEGQVTAMGSALAESIAMASLEHVIGSDVRSCEQFVQSVTVRGDLPIAFAAIERSDGSSLGQHPADIRALANDADVRTFTAPVVMLPERKVFGLIKIGLSTATWRQALRSRAFDLFWHNALAFGLIAVLITWLLRGMVLLPLNRLDRAAARIGRGFLTEAVPVESPNEIGRLARTLDDMRESLRVSHASLAEQNERLRQLDALKDEFLANISHEIRTPLGAIVGSTDLLAARDISPADRHEYIEALRRNAAHLLALVNQALDFSKLQTGNFCIDESAVDLRALVYDVIACLRPRIDEKRLSVKVEWHPDVPALVLSDALRLRQILFNVLGNAVKFTDVGGVTVTARAAGPDDQLEILVQDTGVGLSPEQQHRLFTPFAVGDPSITRRHGGAGLGLVISRKLAEMLGGTVALASQAGKGTTVAIRFRGQPAPSAQAQTTSNVPAGQARLKGRVLLVDDAVDNRRLLSAVLEKSGLDVVTAENGELACVAVDRARVESQPIDLVLMDIQMPVLDGIGAVKRLRAGGCELPCVALTAHATEHDRDTCLAAGFDDYATKPINRKQLADLVGRHLRGDGE